MDRKAVSYNLLVSTLTQARAFLNTQSTVTDVDLRLKRIRDYLKSVGNPERKLKVIHVAGTVGKGSTCTFAAYLLQAAGLKTGLFLSPHLVDFTERIQILRVPLTPSPLSLGRGVGGEGNSAAKEIPIPLFTHYFTLIKKTPTGKKLTPFELLTAMAIHYFVDERVDVAVFEVGLGGRLDATNALQTDVSIITKIGMDHMHWLGDTLEKIAAEKFGILRSGVPAVMSSREKKLVVRGSGFGVRSFTRPETRDPSHEPRTTSHIHCPRPITLPINCPLKGPHQKENASLALKAVEIFLKRKLTLTEKKRGLETAFIPGRLQQLTIPLSLGRGVRGEGNVVIDGAHNPDSAQVLARFLKKECPGKRWIFIVGILKRKDASAIFKVLIPLAHAFYLVPVPHSDCYPPRDLETILHSLKFKHNIVLLKSWRSALSTQHPAPNTPSASPAPSTWLAMFCGATNARPQDCPHNNADECQPQRKNWAPPYSNPETELRMVPTPP